MLRTIKRKYELYKRYNRSWMDRDYKAYYINQRNETNAKIEQAQKTYEETLTNNFKKEPRKFYAYLRSKQKVKVTVNQLGKDDGVLTNNDQDTADVLSSVRLF